MLRFEMIWRWLRFKQWLRQLPAILWFRLRLRGNEFHPSLDFDAERWWSLSPAEREVYDRNLSARRRKAHEIDLLLEDRKHGIS